MDWSMEVTPAGSSEDIEQLQNYLIAFGLLEPPATHIWDSHVRAAARILTNIAGRPVDDVASGGEALAIARSHAESSRLHAHKFLIPRTAPDGLLALLKPASMRHFLSSALTLLDGHAEGTLSIPLAAGLSVQLSVEATSSEHCRELSAAFSLTYPTLHTATACQDPATQSWQLSD